MIFRLRELRLEQNISQKAVAEKLQVSQQTYSDYEHCKTNPDLAMLAKIADFFEVSIDYLLGRTDELGNIAFTAPALPAREQQLLADFRSLAPALQEMLLATIETWKGSKANASTGGKRA